MRPIIEFHQPEASTESSKPKKLHNNSPFNTILSIVLVILMVYLLIKGFIWAWNTLGAWQTL